MTKYLTKNMKLVINEDKTKIYDLTRERMKYLGYDFYVFKQNSKHPKKKGRFMVANVLPKSRANEIAAKCRELLRQIRKHPQSGRSPMPIWTARREIPFLTATLFPVFAKVICTCSTCLHSHAGQPPFTVKRRKTTWTKWYDPCA